MRPLDGSTDTIRCFALPSLRLTAILPERPRSGIPPKRKGLIMAGFNYGYARSKMEKEFAQIAAVCRAEGIPEDTIELIHRIMLDELNSNRRFQTHTQSYDSLRFPNEGDTSADKNPLMDKP